MSSRLSGRTPGSTGEFLRMCRYACPVQHPVVQRACGLLCLDSGTDVSSRLVLRAESPDADHRIKHQRSFAPGVSVPWARARGAPPSSALCLEHVKEHRTANQGELDAALIAVGAVKFTVLTAPGTSGCFNHPLREPDAGIIAFGAGGCPGHLLLFLRELDIGTMAVAAVN